MGIYNRETGKTNLRHSRPGLKAFSDIGTNLHTVACRLGSNETLAKLLTIPTRDALSREVTEEAREALIGEYISIVPIIKKEEEIKNYVIVQFSNFVATSNPLYKQYFLTFDVICNVDNWLMDDYTPRPYKIMSEIDKEIGETKIHSLGPVEFVGADSLVINEKLSGFTMVYKVVSEI